MGDLIRDLRYSVRLLGKRPGFTAVALVSLALGIGANTAIFSLVNELFLRRLPIEHPERVVAIFTVDDKIPGVNQLSHLNWRDLRDQNDTFEQVAGYAYATLSIAAGEAEPRFVLGQMVSGNYFDTLGVRAAHGRTFLPAEDSAPGAYPVAVLGHRFFRDELGGDVAVIGSDVSINGQAFTVIGVAPPDFYGLNIGIEPAAWVPFSMNRVIQPDAELNWFETRRGLFLFGFGRLTEGATVETARANLEVIGERLASTYPDDNRGRTFVAKPITDTVIMPQMRDGVVAATTMLMAVVGLVLLITCVNVANLLLARAAERRKEVAMRLALGVTRGRLLRQLLSESVLIGLLGGALGIVVALLAQRGFLAALPALPFAGNLSLRLSLDPTVLVFTLGLSIFTGLLFGLVPALQSSRPRLVEALKDTGEVGCGSRLFNLRNGLVVVQLALSLVALIGAGLFLRSLVAARKIDLGFPADRLLAISYDVGLAGYDQPHGEQFFRRTVERIAALPGVERAAVAQAGPLQPSIQRSVLLPDTDSDQERTFVQVNSVGPGYFETMDIRVVEGRAFTEFDRLESQPVVVVNQTMAERFWPGESAVGRSFSFFGMESVQVVGVAEDIKYNNPGEDPLPYAYQPLAQQYAAAVTLTARTSGDPAVLVVTAGREIREMDPLVPVINVSTVRELLSNALFAPRFAALFLGILGALALILAAIGIYGVMSYAVARRAHEIGVRVALGADRNRVLGLILRQGLGIALVGLGIGVLLALALTRLIASLLFVSPSDPVAFASTALILLAVALAAVLVPALRAVELDPIRVLRSE